jgi:hypothetical protein
MLPQFDEPEHPTLQVTPAPVASFVTCATTASLPPAPKGDVGAWVKAMLIALVIVTLTV